MDYQLLTTKNQKNQQKKKLGNKYFQALALCGKIILIALFFLFFPEPFLLS